MANELGSHCSYCGQEFYLGVTIWPKKCGRCRNVTFKNPAPVSVALVRVGEGILGVRRSIEPNKGEVCLPGGFHVFGETWQHALVRELHEETGLVIHESHVNMFTFLTDPKGRHNLAFGTVSTWLHSLPTFVPNEEVEELVLLKGDETLCFPLHTKALHQYMAHLNITGGQTHRF